MSDERYTRITLRIPKDLHQRLTQSAEETSKSMNAEIIARLEASFGAEEKEAKLLENFGPKVTSIEQLAADMAALRRLVEEKLEK